MGCLFDSSNCSFGIKFDHFLTLIFNKRHVNGTTQRLHFINFSTFIRDDEQEQSFFTWLN